MAEKKKLTGKQENFCKLYATSEEFFCNGTAAYIKAYNPRKIGNWYNSAKSSAYRLLTYDYILNRINELIDLNGFNDAYVDKQLAKLISQDADFKAKLGAIKEYNELKKRVNKKLELGLLTDRGFSIKITTISNGDKLDANQEADGGLAVPDGQDNQ